MAQQKVPKQGREGIRVKGNINNKACTAKQSCYFSWVFGYPSCVTILTMQCSAGKGFMQWELILE